MPNHLPMPNNPSSKKLRIGLLFGGRSGEHEVSLTSAASVLKALDPAKYEVVPIGITREGSWRVGRAAEKLLPGSGQQSSGLEKVLPDVLKSGKPVMASADPTIPQLVPMNSTSLAKSQPQIDVIFPVLHGTFGEDGTVQGLLELAGIPYVGAGVVASATGMDKDVMKRLFRDAGLPVVRWVLVLRSEWEGGPAGVRNVIENEIGYPLFVKPANLGSSVGISKVRSARQLSAALDLAALYDRKILVECAVDAREIECAVLGNDHPQASVPGEIIPVNEFYDYEAKYVKEGSNIIIPARLTHRQTKRVKEYSVRAFQAIDCAGMARVDFLLDRKNSKVFVNEINTIPGFTPISMYPKMWEATGVPYAQLLDRLIELALERHEEKLRTKFTFQLPK
ncbi:MAG TPA: D-alanine--D-alanine ligase family protein [Terriglobia bacterium]|nr:D-alanine--D-alanine ligase family protein [Terriglobia bacterium]